VKPSHLPAFAAVFAMAMAPSFAAAEFVSKPIAADTPLGTGPYKAIMEMDPRLPTHTLFRPKDMAGVRGRMPVVVWANGACRSEGNRYHYLLTEIASHGYLVLALGPMGWTGAEIWYGSVAEPYFPPGPGQPLIGPPPLDLAVGGSLVDPPTRPSQMVDAIDWAAAENSRRGGRFFGRLDPGKVAVMGTSCGGAQAIEAAADPRVSTTMAWSGAFFPTPFSVGGKTLTKDDLKRIHGPIAYISGDQRDVAFVNASDDFERIEHVPALRAYRKETGHEGTFGEPNGGDFGRVAVAWLGWRLQGDAVAGRMFTGPGCDLCTDPKWVVKQKNLR
jgi:dienelactone hydrolase